MVQLSSDIQLKSFWWAKLKTQKTKLTKNKTHKKQNSQKTKLTKNKTHKTQKTQKTKPTKHKKHKKQKTKPKKISTILFFSL